MDLKDKREIVNEVMRMVLTRLNLHPPKLRKRDDSKKKQIVKNMILKTRSKN